MTKQDKVKNKNLKLRYGITLDTYNEMLDDQEFSCALCGTTEPNNGTGSFAVDHCHTTQRIRGLLCSPCNVGLGMFKENEDILNKAIAYLKDSK